MNTTRNKNISPPACAAAIISVQRAKHQTSRFEELANLPFKENRRTKETAQTLRDKTACPGNYRGSYTSPNRRRRLLPSINTPGATRDDLSLDQHSK
jgi:hypothetical protein